MNCLMHPTRLSVASSVREARVHPARCAPIIWSKRTSIKEMDEMDANDCLIKQARKEPEN